MIRDRNHKDYEKILSLDILASLPPGGLWVDMCCGNGNALTQFQRETTGLDFQLIGVDRHTNPHTPGITFTNSDASKYVPPRKADLITCTYGLLYIDKKIETLQHWYSQLNEGGLLVANVDYSTLILERDTDDKLPNPHNINAFPSEFLGASLHIRKDNNVARIDHNFKLLSAELSEDPSFPCFFSTYQVI